MLLLRRHVYSEVFVTELTGDPAPARGPAEGFQDPAGLPCRLALATEGQKPSFFE